MAELGKEFDVVEGSRFDRCKWRGCEASCVDEIQLCWYHFRIAGETYIEKRSIWGSAALESRRAERAQRGAERAASQPSLEEWSETRSVVYYVRVGDHVKIGYTTYLPARISQLRVERDAVLAVEPGWRAAEAQRHQQFAAERQGRKENFNPSRRLMAHVDLVRSKYGEPWGYAARRVAAAGPQPITG